MRKVGNAKIAFIGMTLEGTPLIVTPAAIKGLEFRDEVETVNNLIAKLKRNDIRTFVVLLHEGGIQNAPFSNANPAQVHRRMGRHRQLRQPERRDRRHRQEHQR